MTKITAQGTVTLDDRDKKIYEAIVKGVVSPSNVEVTQFYFPTLDGEGYFPGMGSSVYTRLEDQLKAILQAEYDRHCEMKLEVESVRFGRKKLGRGDGK